MVFRRTTSLLVLSSLLVQIGSPVFAQGPSNIESLEANLENIKKYKSVPAPLDFQSHPQKTAAGILHWARKDGKAFILLGKRDDGGQWCNFGGKSDNELRLKENEEEGTKDTVAFTPESLVMTAVRESTEESNGLYSTHPRLLRKSPFTAVYMPKQNAGLLYYMFWEKVQYLSLDVFIKKLNASSLGHNKEYTDFIWVGASKLHEAVKEKKSTLDVDGRNIELYDPLFKTLSTDSGEAFLKDLSENNCLGKFKNRKLQNRLYVIDEEQNNNAPTHHEETPIHWDVPIPDWVAVNEDGKWVPNLEEKWWLNKHTDPRKHTFVPFGRDSFGRETHQAEKEKDILAEAVSAHAMAMVQIKRQKQIIEDAAPQAAQTEDLDPNSAETPSRIHLRGVLGKTYFTPKDPTNRDHRRAADIENIKQYFKVAGSELKRDVTPLESDYAFFANILECEAKNKAWPTFYHGATTSINNLYKAFTHLRELIDIRSLLNIIVMRGTDLYFKNDETIWSMLNRTGDCENSETANAMIFLNFVLLACTFTTDSSSSSAEYVLNDHSVSAPRITEKFEESLALAGFNNPTYSYFQSLFEQFVAYKNTKVANSVMFAISQNPEGLDQYSYPCNPGGYYLNETKSTSAITSGIQKQAQNQIDGNATPFVDLSLDKKRSFQKLFPENRLYLHPKRVTDQSKTRITAFDRFPLSEDEQKIYDKEMRRTTVAMLADWLAQQTSLIDGSFVEYPQLKKLYTSIYRGVSGEDFEEKFPIGGLIYLLMNNHMEGLVSYFQIYPQILKEFDPKKYIHMGHPMRDTLLNSLIPFKDQFGSQLLKWFDEAIKENKEYLSKSLESSHVALFTYLLDQVDEINSNNFRFMSNKLSLFTDILRKNKNLKKLNGRIKYEVQRPNVL